MVLPCLMCRIFMKMEDGSAKTYMHCRLETLLVVCQAEQYYKSGIPENYCNAFRGLKYNTCIIFRTVSTFHPFKAVHLQPYCLHRGSGAFKNSCMESATLHCRNVSKMVNAILRHDIICFQHSSFCCFLNNSPCPLTVRLKKILSFPRIPEEILIRMQNTFSQIKDLQFALLCPVSTEMSLFLTSGCFSYDRNISTMKTGFVVG